MLIAAFSLAAIINFSDPFVASRITLLFFYLSLFLFSLSLFTIIGLILRQWLWPKIFVVNLSHSFRQAFLLSILVCASFGLLASRLLFWWVELSLLLFLLCIEILFNLKI
jgi:hypothetical protein